MSRASRDGLTDETQPGGSEPGASWHATWVQHEERGPKPHGLGRGAVSGKLELHDAGVVFRALGLEDSLRCPAEHASHEVGGVPFTP